MLRTWSILFIVLLLAACSSAPPRDARSNGASWGENPRRTMPPGSTPFVDHSVGREEISIEAMSLIGIPYRWGGNTPESGFDCSGLVKYVLGRAANVDLPRTTADISRRGKAIAPDEIAPGDLIFFNTTGRPHSHVGIYVGKLRFVNAPSTGGTVRLDYLTNPYWASRFDGIRRVAPPLERRSPFDAPTELAARPAPSAPPHPAVEAADSSASYQAAWETMAKEAASSPTRSAVPLPAAAMPMLPTSRATDTPDRLDTAADAFEPPPGALQPARQGRHTGALPVQPASAEPNTVPLPSGPVPGSANASMPSGDDPIAQFANSGE